MSATSPEPPKAPQIQLPSVKPWSPTPAQVPAQAPPITNPTTIHTNYPMPITPPGYRPRASQATADYVWRLVVTAVVVILVGLGAAVAIAVFQGIMNVLPLVGMFTAVLTFLAGLLVPSPLQGAARTISSRLKDASEEEG